MLRVITRIVAVLVIKIILGKEKVKDARCPMTFVSSACFTTVTPREGKISNRSYS